jgi:hypothetical protein
VLEATLGGALHLLHLPYKGQVMASIGFFIMAAAVTAGGHRLLPLAVGLVAASFKASDALLLSVPLAERMIVNPMTAILLEALAFQALYLAVTGRRRVPESAEARVAPDGSGVPDPAAVKPRAAPAERPSALPGGTPASSLLLGAAGMYLATAMSALVFFFALRRGPGDIENLGPMARYLVVNGSLGAVLAAAAVPLGALAGRRLGYPGTRAARSRPGLAYGGVALGVACCWALSALFTLLAAR